MFLAAISQVSSTGDAGGNAPREQVLDEEKVQIVLMGGKSKDEGILASGGCRRGSSEVP